MKYAPSTIASHSSAISFIHCLFAFEDPTKSFWIKKFLKGTSKLATSKDSRLPFTKSLLKQLIDNIPVVIKLQCNQVLLKAMFLLAFNGFFRMGEIACTQSADLTNTVQSQDVEFMYNLGQLTGVKITMYKFKHKKTSDPVQLFITANQKSVYCPAQALLDYIKHFKPGNGPLFQFMDRMPVSYSFVAEKLKAVVMFLGLDPGRYKPHSFRIGAASVALFEGHSEDAIRRFGRWDSNAVRNYIRIPSLTLNALKK